MKRYYFISYVYQPLGRYQPTKIQARFENVVVYTKDPCNYLQDAPNCSILTWQKITGRRARSWAKTNNRTIIDTSHK